MTSNTFQTPRPAYAPSVGTFTASGVLNMKRDPTSNDILYPITQQWQNTSTGSVWFLNALAYSNGSLQATWIEFSSDNAIPNVNHELIVGTGGQTFNLVANGATGQVLTATTSADPSFQTPAYVRAVQQITTDVTGLVLMASAGASSPYLMGRLYIETINFSSRSQTTIIDVSGFAGASSGFMTIPVNNAGSSQFLMTNFRLAILSDGHNDMAIICDLSNRNSSTGYVLVTWVGDNQSGVAINLLPGTQTIGSYPAFYGLANSYTQIATDTTTTAASNVFTFQHSVIEGDTPGNNIGAAVTLAHEQANGTIVNGAYLYTKATAAASNTQTTDLHIQTNDAGTLTDQLIVFGSGNVSALTALTVGGTTLGTNDTLTVQNSGSYSQIQALNSGTGSAFIYSAVQTGGGNAFFGTTVNGVGTWSFGNQTGASNAFKISASNALGTDDAVVITQSGQLLYPSQPSFIAYLTATSTDFTGDGTDANIPFNAVLVNRGSNFNTSTGVFTAPVAGLYMFSCTLYLSGLTSSFTSAGWSFSTTARPYDLGIFNPGAVEESGLYAVNASLLISLAATDTCAVNLVVSGSTKTVNVVGSAGASSFTGYLVC